MMHRQLDRFSAGATGLLSAAGAVLMWALVLIVGLQVASRYLLNDSVAWTEEASRLTLVWLSFIGAGAATFLGAHLRLDLVDHAAGRRLRTVALVFAALAALTVLIVMVDGNRELIEIRQGISFTTIDLSSAWLAYAVSVGGGVMIVGTVIRLILDLFALRQSRPPERGG